MTRLKNLLIRNRGKLPPIERDQAAWVKYVEEVQEFLEALLKTSGTIYYAFKDREPTYEERKQLEELRKVLTE